MEQDYSLEEDTQTQYIFTWVTSCYEIFITNIFADSEKEAIIKFFTEEDVDDVENYEIDLTE
tara:strand:+ start:335 stop:520 length:186 start_codon:yes stop_codon:yes gene_type:complete